MLTWRPSMIYASLKDFDKALEYSDKAYQMARVQKDSSMVSHVLFGRAGIFGAKKDYVNAVACRIRWYNISVAAKNEFNTMNAALSISNYYFELDQRENAFKFIRIADSIAKKRKDLYAARRLYELKFELYRKKGQYEIALENRLLYDKLNDSISAIENHEGLEKKEMLLDFEKNELRMKEEQFIKDQKAEAEKKQAENHHLVCWLRLAGGVGDAAPDLQKLQTETKIKHRAQSEECRDIDSKTSDRRKTERNNGEHHLCQTSARSHIAPKCLCDGPCTR
jgi:hypothetical protein